MARRRVCAVDPGRPVGEVARIMSDEAVGAVVVAEGGRCVGIVTDRDLVTRVLAPGLPPDTPVGSVMTPDPVTIDGAEPSDAVQALLQRHGIRQVPVTRAGRLAGIVALEDLVYELTAELRRLLPDAAAESRPAHSG